MRTETAQSDPGKLYNRRVNAWCLYDWANSAFATAVIAVILPLYFAEVAASGLPAARATAVWGLTSSISLALSAILSPIAGVAADLLGRRKRLLVVSAFVGIGANALLATVGAGQWPRACLLCMLAHIPFVISFVCYDSLLPHVARRDDLLRIRKKIGLMPNRTVQPARMPERPLSAINLLKIMHPKIITKIWPVKVTV